MNNIKLTDEEIKLISDAIAKEIYGYGLPNVNYKALKKNHVDACLFNAPEWEITHESDSTFEGEVYVGNKCYTVVASISTDVTSLSTSILNSLSLVGLLNKLSLFTIKLDK